MGKISGWSRRQDEESRDTPFVWREDGGNRSLKVTKRHGLEEDDYEIFVPARPPHESTKVVGREDTKEEARKAAVDWMEEQDEMTLETVDAPAQVGGYELEEQHDGEISYVGVENRDGSRYLVYMEIVESGFQDRSPIYSLRGAVYKDGEFFSDFRPSSKTQHGSPEEAVDHLEDIMRTYDPEDAVDDEVR